MEATGDSDSSGVLQLIQLLPTETDRRIAPVAAVLSIVCALRDFLLSTAKRTIKLVWGIVSPGERGCCRHRSRRAHRAGLTQLLS